MRQQKKSSLVFSLQRYLTATTAMTMAGMLATTAAHADPGLNELPTNFSLESGSVTTPTITGNTMTMTQTSNRALVNWDTFNIGQNATVEYKQRNASNTADDNSAIVVNKVNNATVNRTEIFGTLKANGKVMILDRNGVFISRNATIDVGGIIASTGSMDAQSKADFMAGNAFALDNTDANPDAQVINNANISVKNNGLVAFVAPYVENTGVITTTLGSVTLAAGKKVTLDLAGDGLISIAAGPKLQKAIVKHSGTITANGGTVMLTTDAVKSAVDNLVNMSGVIKANSFSARNGKIVLSANGGKVNVTSTAKLDASRGGAEGAGTAGSIEIYGDNVNVESGATLNASVVASTVPVFSTVTVYKYTYTTYKLNGTVDKVYTADSINGLLAQFPNTISGNINKGLILAGVNVAQVPNGTQTVQTGTQVIDGSGSGGSIKISAVENANFAGFAEFKGAGAGNHGGTVEISGGQTVGFSGSVDASAVGGTRGSLLIDPAVVKIGNSVASDIVTASALAATLGTANVEIDATDKIQFVDAVNLSQYGLLNGSVTIGDLTLDAPTLDVLKDIIIGQGALHLVGVDTVNLGGKLYRNTVPVTTLLKTELTQADIEAGATTVNVLADTASIQQGISFAKNGGSTVNVAAGNYAGNILIDKSLTLHGDSTGANMPVIFGYSLLGSVIDVTANNVTIDGVTVDGAHAPLYIPALTGIHAEGVTGVAIINSKTLNTIGAGIQLVDVNGATVSNNNITLALTGIDVSGGTGINLSGNSITGANTGINLANVVGADVDGNTITGTLGAGLNATGGSDLDVTGNIIAGTVGNGVTLSGISDVSVSGNIIGGGAADAIHAENVSGLDIFLNALGLNAGDGVDLTNTTDANVYLNLIGATGETGVKVNGGSNVDVAGNAILATGGNGVDIRNVDGAYVYLNAIVGAGNDGIYIDPTSGIVGGNLVLNAAHNGITVDGSGNFWIVGNYVDGSGNDGISVDNSDNSIVLLNAVKNSGGAGIRIHNSDGVLTALNDIDTSGTDGIVVTASKENSIVGNHVNHAGREGIYVAGEKDMLIALNHVENSKRDGIMLINAEGTIIGNKVEHSGMTGINAKNTSALITLNDVSDSGTSGIAVDGGKENTVAANKVSKSGADGVSFKGTTGFVLGNTITNSGKNGIFASASSALISLNDVSDSKEDGIHVDGGVLNAVAGNKVKNSGDDGVSFDNTKGTVSANEIDKSGNSGIRIHNSDGVLVTLNDINHSGIDGIVVSASDYDLIVGNHVDHSKREGINIIGGNLQTVSLNSVENSGRDGISFYDADGVIIGNKVDDSGKNGIIVRGADGILISGNKVMDSHADGIYVSDSDDVGIFANKVKRSDGNGIQVTDATDVAIGGNRIGHSGANGILAEGIDGLVISHNRIKYAGIDGIQVENSGDVDIFRNKIRFAQDDGIDVHGYVYGGDGYQYERRAEDLMVTEGGSSGIRIHNNNIKDSGDNGIEAYDLNQDLSVTHNNILRSGNNGIFAANIGSVIVDGNTVYIAGNDGIEASSIFDLSVVNNDVSGYADDGVEVAYSYGVLIDDNTITGSTGEEGGTTGIRLGTNERIKNAKTLLPFGGDFSGNSYVTVSNNTVTGNAVGLDARAFNNTEIAISGNTFQDNTIGMWIGSGLIDLTGDTNTFIGGDTAMRFEPSESFGIFFPLDLDNGDDVPQGPVFTTEKAYLALKDDTIGATVFEGQKTYYIDLENGAFFDPGTPTIIDGTGATYDGVSGGLMNSAQLKAIEGKIHDYDDDKTLGQIFAGLANDLIDDNQVLKKFLNNAYKSGKAGITVKGLPSTNNPGNNGGFFSIQDLANLAPAAGGDDNGSPTNPNDLANLEPAAGGDGNGNGTVNGKCWSNVNVKAGSATSVSLDLSDDSDAILSDASGCSSGI